MNEFTVGDHTYRSSKLPLMTQLHISRRLAPVIAALAATAQSVQTKPAEETPVDDVSEAVGGNPTNAAQVSFIDLVEPLANAMASMSDGDTEYIMNNTLEVVQRKISGDVGWAPIWSKQGRAPLFQDITMIDMLTIATRVIIDQIGPFGAVPSFGLSRPK